MAADINAVVRTSLHHQFLPVPGTPNLMRRILHLLTRFLENVKRTSTWQLFTIQKTETTLSLRFADDRSVANVEVVISNVQCLQCNNCLISAETEPHLFGSCFCRSFNICVKYSRSTD